MKRAKWFILLGLIILAYVGWRHFHGCGGQKVEAGTSEDPSLILDRVWVDSKPVKLSDYVHALLLVDHVPVGVFQKASSYRLLVERFEHSRDGRAVKVRFPQNDRNDRFSYKIRSCRDLPPYDLCLELSKNPWEGPRRYYGVRDQGRETTQLSTLREAMLRHIGK
jgi:hypothetical protein